MTEYPTLQAALAAADTTPNVIGVEAGTPARVYYQGDTLPAHMRQESDPRADAWDRIKAERDRRQSDGGVEVGGHWFLSNDREAGRYNSIITVAAALGASGSTVIRPGWRTMQPGVTVDMTANLARSILTAGFAQFAAIDDAAQAHRAAMEASADPASYDFSGGWPLMFGG